MTKRKEKKILVNATVVAENLRIFESIRKFSKIKMCNLEIQECKEDEQTVEIFITLVTKYDYQECIELIKELNQFLFEEETNNKFGFTEIITIPASYEVIENENR